MHEVFSGALAGSVAKGRIERQVKNASALLIHVNVSSLIAVL
jgi:hypothetical protein